MDGPSCPRCGHADKAPRANPVQRAIDWVWRLPPACPSRDVEMTTEWGGEVCGCRHAWHVAGT